MLAAFVSFGIQAPLLLTASVMAAPAALAWSKLVYPETEKSRTKSGNIKIEKGFGRFVSVFFPRTLVGRDPTWGFPPGGS